MLAAQNLKDSGTNVVLGIIGFEEGSFTLASKGAQIISYKLSKRLKELAASREDKVDELNNNN